MQLIEFHEAFYERLEKHLDRRISIFDYLPPNEPYPFVVLTEMTADRSPQLSNKLSDGYTITQRIVVGTRAKEKKVALEILKQIRKALDTDLDVEGAFNYGQKFLNITVETTSDAKYYCETNFEIILANQEEL